MVAGIPLWCSINYLLGCFFFGGGGGGGGQEVAFEFQLNVSLLFSLCCNPKMSSLDYTARVKRGY